MKKYAIIVAAGKGQRMQSDVPKQFLKLGQKLVLMYSIEKFHLAEAAVIVTLHPAYVSFWKAACEQYQFKVPHQIVLGGEERFHSIQNALILVKDQKSLVAVHDAARPNISQDLIQNSFKAAMQYGNAIPVISSTDSIRHITAHKAVNRAEYCLVQTPQVFQFEQLEKAYQQGFSKQYTDDASVVESLGLTIQLIEGEKNNFKITFPEDLIMMEALMKF